MVIDFKIHNFRSLKNENTLSFLAYNKLKNKKDHLYSYKNINILKNIGLFGANSFGKSNIFKAFKEFKNIVINEKIISKNHFTFIDQKNIPTTFTIRLLIKNKIYSYSLSILINDNKEEIINEYLIEVNEQGELIQIIFDEDLENKKDIKNRNLTLLKSYYLNLDLIKNNKNIIKDIYYFFKYELLIYEEDENLILKNCDFESINKLVLKLDLGIEKIEFKEINSFDLTKYPFLKEKYFNKKDTIYLIENKNIFKIKYINKKYKIYSLFIKHSGIEELFSFEDESRGSIKLFELIFVLFTKNDYQLTLIDEIESSLHPLVAPFLLKLFNKYNENKLHQIVYSSHLVSLIEIALRKDEVYLVHKESSGESKLYSLLEFKEVSSLNLLRKYLEGRYGSIPLLDDF